MNSDIFLLISFSSSDSISTSFLILKSRLSWRPFDFAHDRLLPYGQGRLLSIQPGNQSQAAGHGICQASRGKTRNFQFPKRRDGFIEHDNCGCRTFRQLTDSVNTWRRDLHPAGYVPCPAHTTQLKRTLEVKLGRCTKARISTKLNFAPKARRLNLPC